MLPILNKVKLLLTTGFVALIAAPVGVVPGETIALWNFNESSGPNVADGVTTGGAVDGTASANVQIVSGSVIGAGFGSARDFSVAGSYVSFGEIATTKLELKNRNQAAVEAMVYLTSDATTPVTIFDNRELQLQVVNNRLSAFVRQSSGFKGVVSSVVLAKNTAYRVGAHLNNGYLVVSIDNKVVGNVKISEAIQTAENGAIAYIGGDSSSMNFPGIVDDVRLSSVVTLDTVPPQISIVSPDTSVPLVNGNPNFIFSLTDNEDEIDPMSISVKLNGVAVTGLAFNPATKLLSGYLSTPLVAGKKNLVDISVKDNVGNPVSAQYEVKYIKWGSGEEYESDEDTLGLWHLNDQGVAWAKDSSSYVKHGKYKLTQPVPGVMGKARLFSTQYSVEEITLPPVLIPGSVFTFEAWVRPLSDATTKVDIFNNDQIVIQRTDVGSVVVNLKTYYQTNIYTSTVGVLPIGKWSHVKVVYDGRLSLGNLLVLVDGLVVTQFDAIPDCEFDEEPKIARIGGNGFKGEIDEVRLSKVVRESVNLIRGNPPTVELAYPVESVTVRSANANIYAKIFDADGISPTNVQVKLNGITQTGLGLNVTSSEIKGTLPSQLSEGLNEIEIRVTGQSGNQTVLQRRFFYIQDGGLVEYSSDINTVGLWHFNEDGGAVFADASGNNHPMTSTTAPVVVAGKFGNGRKGSSYALNSSNINFVGKSFTVEGWFKRDPGFNGQQLWRMFGGYFNTTMNVNVRNLELGFSIPGSAGFTAVIPEVFSENEYRHVAVSYNGDIDNSNILVLVDGIVKYSKNFKSYCKSCMASLSLEISPYNNSFDEIRVSNVARNKFNVGSGQGPSIGFLQTLPLATVHSSQPPFKILFADDASIDQSTMSLAVNGVIDTTLVKSVSGTTGTLAGVISLNLTNGANEITVRAKNQNGQESVQNFYVFYITKGTAAAYSPDSTTVGLWHFNSGSGAEIVSDVSGRAFNWNSLSSPTVTAGVFGQALYVPTSTYLYPTAFASAAPATKSWTFETWVSRGGSSNFNQSISYRNILSMDRDGAITFTLDDVKTTPIGTIPQDGKFHHLAFVVDENNPHRQVLLVVDGTVVESMRKSNLPSMDFSYANGTWYDLKLDEMRLSNVAQYTLSYEKPVSMLFKNSRILNKKK